jgi:hypothetical protein
MNISARFPLGPLSSWPFFRSSASRIVLALLLATFTAGSAIAVDTVTRGPYLQTGTPSSVIVRWRTDTASDSSVRFGTNPASLGTIVTDPSSTTEHEVQLTGLSAATRYYYSVGTSVAPLASGADYFFETSPPVGTAQATRVWILGDSGTKNATAAAVRNGYTSFDAGRYTNVWLMLGDNAYDTGTDSEYQAAVFDMYPSYLRQSVLWSTIGNHDTAQSTNPSLAIPYFQIFNNPTTAAAGGVSSGTEKYYSFDYGRIHFISLDSMTSSRAPGSDMLNWLELDLGSTTQDWIIAFWHHPAYTKGSHNSDTETQLIEMRTNVLPILEAGGVDLVLTGHSHSYERTYLINGHYGLSTTFTQSMKLNGGSGREDGTGVYDKPTNLVANKGAVYIVAGNGGHVTNWVGGSTAEYNPNPPPAMYYSALHTGSVVLDIDGDRLDAKMIRENGSVDDYFSIVKTEPTPQAPLAPASLTATAGNAKVTLSWPASAGALSYSVKRSVANGGPYSLIASGLASTGYVDNAVNNGTTYFYVVSASNAGGESSNSVQATALPTAPAAVPTTPGNLNATAVSKTQINLAWTDSSYETSYLIERSTSSNRGFKQIASVGANVTSYASSGLKSRRTYYYRVRASNATGNSGYSNVASATSLKK